MSEKCICKYCGMELLEDMPHGLRQCHLHAVARIAELEMEVEELIDLGNKLSYVVYETQHEKLAKKWTMLVSKK